MWWDRFPVKNRICRTIEQLRFAEKISNLQQTQFLANKLNFKHFAAISLPFCNLEVRIRIESLAMQNCESRNCQFSGKSRNIQNCFWRPSPQFTSYTWISMTLDILVQTKVGNLYETDVFQTFQEFPRLLCLQKNKNWVFIALSTVLGWALAEIKKSWFCFLSFSEGKLDMKLKQSGGRSSKTQFSFNFRIASNLSWC